MRMPNGKKQPGAAGLPAPVLRASPRRNAIRSTSTTIASTTNLNTTKNAGIATDLVKKLDDRLGSQKQKPTTGAGVGITDIQPQATTSTSTSASTSTSTSTSGGGTRSVLLPSHNPNSNSFGPDTQQGPGEQQRDGARDGNGNGDGDGDGDGDGSMEQRRGEDMPLQVQESGSFSSTVIPPTPIKSRPIKGKGKRSGGMGTQKEGSGANREEQMEVSSGEQAGLDLDTDSNSKLKPTSTSSSNSALRTNKDQPGTMGRSFFRSISASHLPPPGSHHHHHHSQQRVGDIDPTLRVPKVVRRGSSGQSSLEGSAAGSRSGSGQISISRAGSASGSTSGGTTRSRSVSQEGSSLGQAYVAPPQPQHSNSGSSSMHSNSNSNAAKQGQIMGQTYSVPMHASHTGGHLQRHAQGQELVMQPLQPQPVRAAKGYVVYPSAEQHSQHHPQQIASGSRPQYWMDPATGKYYEDPGVQEYGYAIGPPVVYATGYPHPQPIPHPQAVQYHQPGYPVQQHYAQVDSRGFVIPDRSLSVSRTSSRSAGPGSGRYRRSEGGEGGEGGEDDTASVHSHSSNSAAFTARILAGMGTTGGSGSGSGSGAKRGEMGDTLKVPGASDGKKGKNKEKKVKEAGTSAKKGKKPVSANTSSTRDDDQDKESDGGTAVPPAWRPDLRPGDTVTDPKYPEAHGCPYCDKVYRGQHARSICRRHQMSKHGIELEVQVKKSRWDNNPNRPANEEEKHRRTLESKRRWAAKDRRRRRAEKLGLPMPESSDEEDYDMRSESGSIAQSVTDTATSKATPSRSGSPHANTLPVKGGRAKRRSGSGLRDVSIPPQPTRRITSQEAVRLAAMERVRLRKAQPDWQDDGSSEEDEGEGDDEAPIQETDIVVDPSPQVPRGHAQNQRVGARQPKSTPTKTSQRQDIAIDPRIHPAFLPAEEQRMLHEHHQPYKSDVQQLQPQADTVVESAVPPVSHKTPIGQLRQPLIQHSKEATKSSATRSGQSRRAAPPPALLRSNEADVFGSGHSSMGSLDLLADTLDRAQPMTPTTGKTMVPGPLQPPIFKTPAPVSKSRSSNVGSKKPNTDRNGPDNNEAAEILLAISASPAPNLRKTPIDDDIGTMDHGNGTAMGGDSMGPRTGDRMMIGRRQLDLENDGDIEMDNLEADSRAAAMNETPSRPSGPRRKPANNATPIRKLPMRSTRTGERPPSDDEFAVPELQSTTNDPSSSVSKRHEDSPITPAELQPAADILPYRRGKPPTYGRKDGGGDRAIIAKSDLSSPPSGLPVTKATPTPKMSTLRSGVTPFQGYRPGALATPARPGHMAGIAGSPADYTTFSSPSGLDLTQKLGLAPAPTVPESPTWLEMVRATPDARQKRARPGSMDSDAGAAPDSPRKRVRV